MNQASAFEFNFSEEFPRLPGAPIVEAVIHVTARGEKTLQEEFLKDRLAALLPGYPGCQPQRALQLEAQFGESGSLAQIRQDNWRGLRLTSSDKLYIAQFTRDGFVFSRLKPYETWEAFSQEGLRLWRIYADLVQPPEIQQLEVRYINRVDIPNVAGVSKYLANAPKCLEGLGLPKVGFLHQSAHEVPGHPFKIVVLQTVQPPIPGKRDGFGLILDIVVSTSQPFPYVEEELNDRLSKMRWLKDRAFFSLMTQKAIHLFENPIK